MQIFTKDKITTLIKSKCDHPLLLMEMYLTNIVIDSIKCTIY